MSAGTCSTAVTPTAPASSARRARVGALCIVCYNYTIRQAEEGPPMVRQRIRVDLRSKVPAYLQIVEQVRALTAAGMLRPGDQLPTIRDMAGEAHINFNTVARAYRVLDGAGGVSTQHGRGTYAVPPAPPAGGAEPRRRAPGRW